MISLGLYNYWIVIALMMVGLYIMISRGNLIKKIVGLNIFQSAVFIMNHWGQVFDRTIWNVKRSEPPPDSTFKDLTPLIP